MPDDLDIVLPRSTSLNGVRPGSKIRDMFGNAAGRIECIMGERYLPYLEQVKIREARLDIALISRDPACGDR